MRLSFLLFDYFPYGGLQRDCLKIANLCAVRGHAVTILTRTWQGERPDRVEVELFGRRGISNVSRNRNWLRQLAATLPRRGSDGLIGFNKLPGLDVYYGSDPCYVAKTARLKPFWYRWLPRYQHFCGLERAVFAHGQTTRILLLTPHEIPAYQDHYQTEVERFHVLPPGVPRLKHSDASRAAARQRLRTELGCAADELLLLIVGSGFRVKGLDRAIKALATLPAGVRDHTRLVVIGQGRPGEFAWLARWLGVAGRVHFLGGRTDVPDWLLAADLLLHPAYSESAGMTLLEALTAGLPVLTTDTCGYAPHVERAGAGLVVKSPFAQNELNGALQRMLSSSSASPWRDNGLRYAANEDLYSCHEKAVQIIESVIRNKQDRPPASAA
jgi:UDP-glucose:(heptosyl)LPS alpha-1,3-glucosyltransferase